MTARPGRLRLYGHPFSSYCQKALVALHELDLDFDWRLLSSDRPEIGAEFARLWPLAHMPLLMDGDVPVREATIIVEHLDLRAPGGPRLLPADPQAALQARFLDRVFDNFAMTPMQRIVFDRIRPEAERDPRGVAEARALLDRAYSWLDGALPAEGWAAGGGFGLADCAAAPALLYADWVHPIPDGFARLRAYRGRLLARPSFARAVEEARPYRGLFPGGAPERD